MVRKSVNIVLLNYNGKALLEKYLPSVVEAAGRSRHNCRVSVIDNKSSDASVDYIRGNFKDVLLYEAKENRLLCSYNDYLRTIDDDIVIFLNTDIRVDPGFVDPLIEHFDDESLLFAAPKELSMEGRYQGNLNSLIFKYGILSTKVEVAGHDSRQYDISVHGGAFDRGKFLELGGYDDMYLPGIVEDFDLCYRGWKRGWKGVYEPRSFYYHEGSTSFNAKYGTGGRALLAHRNTFLFFWKNVTSKKMMAIHAVFIPVLLLAAVLRTRWLFVKGFFQALSMIGRALKRRAIVAPQFQISDEELMKRSGSAYQDITEPPHTSIWSPTT